MKSTAKVLILDFGSQVTQLIARRIREIGIYCEIQAFYKPIVDPNNEIKTKVLNLLHQNPNMPIYKIGFFNNWQNEPIWR